MELFLCSSQEAWEAELSPADSPVKELSSGRLITRPVSTCARPSPLPWLPTVTLTGFQIHPGLLKCFYYLPGHMTDLLPSIYLCNKKEKHSPRTTTHSHTTTLLSMCHCRTPKQCFSLQLTDMFHHSSVPQCFLYLFSLRRSQTLPWFTKSSLLGFSLALPSSSQPACQPPPLPPTLQLGEPEVSFPPGTRRTVFAQRTDVAEAAHLSAAVITHRSVRPVLVTGGLCVYACACQAHYLIT